MLQCENKAEWCWLCASLLLLHEYRLPLWFASKISPGNRCQQLLKHEFRSRGVVALWFFCSALSYRTLLQGKHGLYLLGVFLHRDYYCILLI